MTGLSLSKKRIKEEEIMSEKQKSVHNAYCDYEIAKANQPTRVRTYSAYKQQKTLGIRTSGLSKAMLAMQLASLF